MSWTLRSCPAADRLAKYFDSSQPRASFDDTEIEDIGLLLSRCGHAANKSPRTYIILRTIGRLTILQELLTQGFGDGWFPVELRGLPGFLDPRDKASIAQNQHLILTKSLSLENGHHCYCSAQDNLPFTVLSYIGAGSYGQVRKIESKVTFRHYALKTIRRRVAFNNRSRQAMDEFLGEMQIIKRLNHRHVVQYVGSYTDAKDLGLIMTPIAECNLTTYLQRTCTEPEQHPTLRTFFGCLATALSYLHENEIKHRDIKPQNILVHRANVLLTDFGLSRDFLDTTSGPTPASPRYCSPEVAARESRNESADVWSLGCVFLEMVSALQGHDLEWLRLYYERCGTGSSHYHANPEATERLLQEWQNNSKDTQVGPLDWIQGMLTLRRDQRQTAAQIVIEITASDSHTGFMYSCNSCCETIHDSDSLTSQEDHVPCAIEPVPGSRERWCWNTATLAAKVATGPLISDEQTNPHTMIAILDTSAPAEQDVVVKRDTTASLTEVYNGKAALSRVEVEKNSTEQELRARNTFRTPSGNSGDEEKKRGIIANLQPASSMISPVEDRDTSATEAEALRSTANANEWISVWKKFARTQETEEAESQKRRELRREERRAAEIAAEMPLPVRKKKAKKPTYPWLRQLEPDGPLAMLEWTRSSLQTENAEQRAPKEAGRARDDVSKPKQRKVTQGGFFAWAAAGRK